jgi:hypothetical protein
MISRVLNWRKLLRTQFCALIGSPAVSGAISSCSTVTIVGSFFDLRSATALAAHTIGRLGSERCCQFLASAPDRLFVQSGDLGQQPIPTMANPVGFQRDKLAALRFIQATEEPVDLAMPFAIRMIGSLLAQRTLTHWYIKR